MKKLYRIKQNCFIGFSNYSAGQVVFLDESLASNSLTELTEPEIELMEPEKHSSGKSKADKSVTSYDNKMINSAQLKTKKQKKRKLLKT